MLTYFRVASLLEGISYLVILCVTFGIISREFVFMLGMVHGVLFLVYFVLSLMTSHKQGWSIITWLLIFFAAIIPFAFLAVDVFLQKEIRRNKNSQ